MPTYGEWNAALIEHVVDGAPVGSTVYLEASDETLMRVGVQRWGEPTGQGGWREDFLSAVRKNSVWSGGVATEWMLATDKNRRPLGVGFLAAMVLAASHMATDTSSALHERNYFRRLSEVLGLDPGQSGRPPGLGTGAEEPLWKAWLSYLQSRSLNSTARGGEGGRRFISYPISQTLISEGERQRLRRLFAEREYPASWDGETLASHLRGDRVPSAKLRELLSRSGAAAEDVQQALLDVFQGFQAAGPDAGQGGSYTAALGVRQLSAGLYRSEHWRTGRPEYQVFPRQPRGVRLTQMTAELPTGAEVLVLERPGHYRPIGQLAAADFTSGQSYPVTGSPFIDALVLPARDFWILREDPDAQGMYASLGTPGVGEHMLLLLRDTLLSEVLRFQAAGLLTWQGKPAPIGDGWTEIHGLMVTGNHWDEVPAGVARILHEALRPPGGVGIHLEGGVRVQRAGAYLAGAGPTVRVMSFSTDASLTVYLDQEELSTEMVVPGQVLNIPMEQAGAYELIVESRGMTASRLVTVMGWEDLKVRPHAAMDALVINGHQILGAQVLL